MLGSDEIYREWAYVALSRGGDANRLYVTRGSHESDDDLHAHDSRKLPDDPVAELAHAFGRSHAQHLAIDHHGPSSSQRLTDQETADLVARRVAQLRGERERTAEQAANVQQRLATAEARLKRLGRISGLISSEPVRQVHTDRDRLAGDLHAWHQRIARLDADIARSGQPAASPPRPAEVRPAVPAAAASALVERPRMAATADPATVPFLSCLAYSVVWSSTARSFRWVQPR